MKKRYYGSIEEYEGIRQETEDDGSGLDLLDLLDEKTMKANASRRDFLKLFGFSIASAAVAASCEQPVRKAIPYLIKPETVTPGKADYYASTFFDGNDYCSVLVKVRDGRPIKIEGNELSSVTMGRTNARTQASVLSLYDTSRYQRPVINGIKAEWDQTDSEITRKLKDLASGNKAIVLLTSTIISPSTREVIREFVRRYPSARHAQYDAVSYSGMILANEISFGKRIIPSYDFANANLIVSFGADFLGNWLSPVEFTRQYVTNRKLDEGQQFLSKHIHFEGGMSLTGSNADQRIVIRPSQEKGILANLFAAILEKKTGQVIRCLPCEPDITALTEELLNNKGRSLVVTGSNNTGCQVLVNTVNYLLGNYGHTIDLNVPIYSKQGIDSEMADLVGSMNRGEIGALICYNVNPAYDYPEAEKFTEGLKKCELTVSLANLKDETAELASYICPDHYYLESWNDSEIKKGVYSLTQPAIHPIFDTRSAQETLLRWSGIETSYPDFIKSHWKKHIYPLAGGAVSFYDFWTGSLRDGVFEGLTFRSNRVSLNLDAAKKVAVETEAAPQNSYELVLYENISMGNGKQANNPWLQELPDPLTRICWDNYAMISPRLAREKNLETGSLIVLNGDMAIPVMVQPGQEYRTISVALGYGRTQAGLVADNIGINAYKLATISGNQRHYSIENVTVDIKPGNYLLAMVQTHHSMEGRAIVRETTFDEYVRNPASGNELHEEIEKEHTTLYRQLQFKGHHWGMAVDLNSCTGCSACVIACSSENNVPVVGKREVSRVHEMHWIRIDRYYSGDPENPEVIRQPVMCQHCDNAPCENVCPVAATNHSDEGLNQMIYNRCIGTRYCNNNCPYKVRRFNFWDYTMADAIPFNTKDPEGMTLDLKRMVLNPDVTVRAKGVIEKCSMCVQRIQEKKLDAKLGNRPIKDGEIVPACAQACPADAIVFGDLNNPDSKISKLFGDKRNYHLLEELHTLPSVGYLTKVRNKKAET